MSAKKNQEKDKVEFNGILEVDINRGVVYFHSTEASSKGMTLLRIGGIPENIIENIIGEKQMGDVFCGFTEGRKIFCDFTKGSKP